MHPIKRSALYINLLFALVISIGAVALLLHYEITQAKFYAPRLINNCERGFIGYEYNSYLDKSCRPLWNLWTRQIKNNHKLSAGFLLSNSYTK